MFTHVLLYIHWAPSLSGYKKKEILNIWGKPGELFASFKHIEKVLQKLFTQRSIFKICIGFSSSCYFSTTYWSAGVPGIDQHTISTIYLKITTSLHATGAIDIWIKRLHFYPVPSLYLANFLWQKQLCDVCGGWQGSSSETFVWMFVSTGPQNNATAHIFKNKTTQ